MRCFWSPRHVVSTGESRKKVDRLHSPLRLRVVKKTNVPNDIVGHVRRRLTSPRAVLCLAIVCVGCDSFSVTEVLTQRGFPGSQPSLGASEEPPAEESPTQAEEPPAEESPAAEEPRSPDEEPAGGQEVPVRPNILLITSDDQGVDASAQYPFTQVPPNTPTLDRLAANGLVFENTWATPACTTTRGTIITGQHAVNSGINRIPSRLPTSAVTLYDHLSSSEVTEDYATAHIGKWHLSSPGPAPTDPNLAGGVDFFAGTLNGAIQDYNRWPLVEDGQTSTSTEYHTTAMANLAEDWIEEQSQPWLLWLSFVAPHTPLHLPPASLHTRNLDGTDIGENPREYYLAAIEAMDTEIGRLLASMSEAERDNTVIFFLGDNGSPAQAFDADVFARGHIKGSLYEGGVRVPFVASGFGVARGGEREAALVNTVDLFPTIVELASNSEVSSPESVDGRSFAGLLSSGEAPQRRFNYTEYLSNAVTGWAVRGERYKLIEFEDGTQELYDMEEGVDELNNLIDQDDLAETVQELATYAAGIQGR